MLLVCPVAEPKLHPEETPRSIICDTYAISYLSRIWQLTFFLFLSTFPSDD
jgi:hypothetical protein